MKTKTTLVGLIMLTLVSMIHAQSIIPEPVSIKRGSSSFTLTASTVISTSHDKSAGVKQVATYLAKRIKTGNKFYNPNQRRCNKRQHSIAVESKNQHFDRV